MDKFYVTNMFPVDTRDYLSQGWLSIIRCIAAIEITAPLSTSPPNLSHPHISLYRGEVAAGFAFSVCKKQSKK